MKRRRSPFLGAGILTGVLMLGIGLAAYGYWVEPFWVQVTRREIPIRGLDPGMDGFTILQLSDIHISDWMLQGYLDQVVDQSNALHPDVIALTGDYVYHNVDQMVPELHQFFSRLKPNQATLAILGNHDHWQDAEIFRDLFTQSGVIDLSNTTIEFSRGGGHLIIAGLDDPWVGVDNLSGIEARIPDGQKAILLVHEPDFADRYAPTEKFSLQLSGHSHGGQVRLPLFGAMVLPENGKKYQAGLYQIGDMWLYTNRGIGSVPFRFRLNCRPEITLFTLRARPG
jgi:uncharacterized protein